MRFSRMMALRLIEGRPLLGDLATPLGVDPDAMLDAVILLVAVLPDPAAVLLLVAATAKPCRLTFMEDHPSLPAYASKPRVGG
jgi:hypothetical protein